MEISIIDNNKEIHEHDIVQLIKSSTKLTIAVAFFKSSGLDLIWNPLKSRIKKVDELLIVVGLDFFQTEPNALWQLFELQNKYSAIRIKTCQKKNQVFHPKLYLSEQANSFESIVGSANMTNGGLNKNFELSCRIFGDKSELFYTELRAYVDSLESNSVELTPATLSQYQRKFDINKKNIKAAEKQTKKELDEINDISSEKLNDYLEEYLADDEEKKNWQRRIKDYRKAKKILNQLADSDDKSKADFMNLYNNLIGGRGYEHLWHSGSIHRSKNKISKKRNSFCRIVEAIRTALAKGEEPHIVFEDSMKLAEKIDGLGVNIITEIMNTYAPKKCSVLNKNPLTSLNEIGFQKFKSSQSFKGIDYKIFNELMLDIAKRCDLKNLGQADHLCNYIYWKIKK